MTTIRNGLVGGAVVALLAATATRLVVGRLSAPESVSTATLESGNRPSRRWAFLLQLLYGSVAGGALVALELFVLGVLAVPPTTGEALGVALVWSTVLLFTAIVGLRFGFESPVGRLTLGALLVYHLVYGLGLGIWIRATWIT